MARQSRLALVGARAAAAAAAAVATAALAAGGHQHGVAWLDVAVDGNVLSVSLRMPMDSLVGFERAPRTPAQHQALQAATTRLGDVPALFKLEPSGLCALEAASVRPPAFDGAHGANDAHVDVEVDYRWRCAPAAKLASVEVMLFATFPRLHRVEGRAALPQGQRKFVLRPAQRVLRLDRPR